MTESICLTVIKVQRKVRLVMVKRQWKYGAARGRDTSTSLIRPGITPCQGVVNFDISYSNMGGESHPRAIASSYPKLASGPVGQHIQSIYKERIGQFRSGGQYEGQNLLK